MRKITLGLLAFASVSCFGQTVLINPDGDGGFETGATFTENGWSTAQQGGPNKKWYCGTGQAGFTGNRCAFIGNDETTVGNNNSARTVHLYRAVTFPVNATNIVLTFKYKQAVSDFISPNYYDYITVSTGTDTPVNATVFSTGDVRFGPYPDVDVTEFTTQTINLPNELAGTTTNLVFTFNSDNVNPRGFGAIDDVSLIYTPNLSVPSVEEKPVTFFPNPVKNVLNLANTSTIHTVSIYDLNGKRVLLQQVGKNEAVIDISSLATGNYMVSLTTDTLDKTLKIIKE